MTSSVLEPSGDPHELNNLADQPEHAAKIAELTALRPKDMTAYADLHPLTVANPESPRVRHPVPAANQP